MEMRFVTLHRQSNGRYSLGNCVHKYKDCQSLKSRTGIEEIDGPIVQKLPKCSRCYNRLMNPKGGENPAPARHVD